MSQPTRPRPTGLVRVRMIAAAQFRAMGLSQAEIAAHLSQSQPEISRLLALAEQEHILQTQPTLEHSQITEDELADVEALYGHPPTEDEQQLAAIVPRMVHFTLHTVRMGDRSKFSAQAAHRIARLLDAHTQVCGTLWGRTLDGIIDGVHRWAPRNPKGREFQAIPLAGDPLYLLNQDNQQFTASSLAAKLERAFTNRVRSDLPSLTGVPAYIARRWLEESPDVLNGFFESIPGYKTIFGPSGMVHRVDTVLTGVGVFSTKEGQTASFLRERIEQEGSEFLKCRRYILGDFSGNLVARPGLSTKDQQKVEAFNQGWKGISLDELKQIAGRAKKHAAVGVIAVAFGGDEGTAAAADRAAILREVLSRGLINHLVVDDELARRLVKLVEKE